MYSDAGEAMWATNTSKQNTRGVMRPAKSVGAAMGTGCLNTNNKFTDGTTNLPTAKIPKETFPTLPPRPPTTTGAAPTVAAY